MKVNQVIEKMNAVFPEWLQEEYDNTGSQVVFPEETVSGIYICLDADIKTIADAVQNRCNLIISHHPMIFRPLKKIVSDDSGSRALIKLIDERVSLFALHTNFDRMMHSYLSESAGFNKGEILLKKGILNEEELGYGSFVKLEKKMKFKEIIEKIKKELGLEFVICSGDTEKEIGSAAFVNGAGGGSIEKIINSRKPDCIITGDVGFHHAKYAIENNVCVIDAGHYGTEIIFKKLLAQSINDNINVNDNYIDIIISAVEKNPFQVY